MSQPHTSLPAAPTFADITRLLPEMPGLPPGADWLAQSQHRPAAQLLRPKLALFCAAHRTGPIESAGLFAPWQAPEALGITDGELELQLYDLAAAPINPTGPLLDETMAANAMIYGMTLPGQGFDLLALGTVGDGATGADTAALALIHSLFRQESQQADIRALMDASRPALTDPLASAAALGGHDICAMIGAILAARMAHLPVLVQGLPAYSAALAVAKLGGRDLASPVRALPVELPTDLKIPELIESYDAPDLIGAIRQLQDEID